MVNFTNGSGKDLEIHRRDQKMFLGKTMGKFHLSEMNQFEVFPIVSIYHSYFTILCQDVCKRSLVQNTQFDPWDPCQKRVKNVLENPPYFLLVKWAVPVRRPRENGT
jgi:hypothetical protein